MSGWVSPPVDITSTSEWFWRTSTQPLTANEQFAELFEVQRYVGPLEVMCQFVYDASEGHYRILTKPPPQRLVAAASTRARAEELAQAACAEILPRVSGLSPEQFHSVLPTIIEKLSHQNTLQLLRDWNLMEESGIHTVDLSTVIEGIKNDSLMMSITFEYDYKYPVSAELLCSTCMLPAVDPHVSPFFIGKVFCGACTVFEAQGSEKTYFLKANNLAALLDELEVYCPFAAFGCAVCLPRGLLGGHLQECPHIRIVCVNKSQGCKFGAKSKVEAIEHMQSCQFASLICRDLCGSQEPAFNPRNPTLPLPHHIGDVINASIAADTANSDASVRAGAANDHSRKCTLCALKAGETAKFRTEPKSGEACAFHSGTWSGYTYAQVQEWRFYVWRNRLSAGVKTVVHLPVEIAKSTTALGVGIISFGALIGGAAISVASLSLIPEILMLGGFLLAMPSSITSIVAGTIFSPTLFYNLLYKYPYKLLWGNAESPEAWTCCKRIGSNAEPCEKRGVHSF